MVDLAKLVEQVLSMEHLEHTAQKASYRRGTIMGLTAAEAFMLICFVLLMLLMLWRAAAEEELRVAEEFGDNFTEEQKKLVIANKERLVNLDAVLEDIEKMRPILEAPGMTPERVADLMQLQERIGTLDPSLLDDRLRLVSDEDIRRAAEAMQTVDEEELLELVDMIEAGKIGAVLRAAQLEATPDEVETLRAQNAELTERIEAYEETGLQPSEVEALSDVMLEVEAARSRLDATGADIAQKLRDKVGPEIERLGGRILDSGDVIFPDRLLFPSGSAEIQPAFDALLRDFCRSWFEVLYAERMSLETVQIEGHASSEYGNLPDRPAFDLNLDLSQRRSAAVFRRCLDYGGSDEIAAWARAATAAVGYSSSLPVVDARGEEDRRASRRVVFAIDMRSEDDVVSRTLDGSMGGLSSDAPAQ